MNILIVGALGVLGSALAEFFKFLGFNVSCVDRDTLDQLSSLAEEADVAFIAVPISSIARVAAILAQAMRPGTLIISGGSVAEPTAPSQIDLVQISERGITFALVHLMFRPGKPLAKTVFGENIGIWLEGEEKWREWIKAQFEPKGAICFDLAKGMHDRITMVSQLFHMIVAIQMAGLWGNLGAEAVRLGVATGGFPCKSVVRSGLRSCQRPDLLAEILKSHPHAQEMVETLRATLDMIAAALQNHDTVEMEAVLTGARGMLDLEQLDQIDWLSGELVRLEADLRHPHRVFDFPPAMNSVGLLGQVMAAFDELGVNKTSTFAHNLPNGGCRFIVGVEEVDERVQQAERIIRSWVT